MNRDWAFIALLACGALFGSRIARGQTASTIQVRKALINQDIVEMTKAKFADSTIIKMIGANDTEFDVSVQAVLQLKSAGVSQPVIQAMLSAGSKRVAVVAPKPVNLPRQTVAPLIQPQTVDIPDEIGIYYRQGGKLVGIEPEIVSWKTGGVAKSAATLGLDKGHINGTVRGSHSKLDLTSGANATAEMIGIEGSLEFYLRCADGNSASEYQLLRFWEKGDRREFRSVTGGVLHASGGAQDNVLEFKFEKVSVRTYKMRLKNLAIGEYGFLAPGTTASLNAASQGKVYTFRIIE